MNKKRKITISLIVLSLFLVLTGSVLAYTYTNSLQINTLPTGAKVYVDGNLKGNTPLTLTDLYDTDINSQNSWEKRHWVQIYKDGWKSVQEHVNTPVGSHNTLNIQLERDPQVRFSVMSGPSGAKVYIKDHAGYMGVTPLVFNFSVPDYINTYTWKIMVEKDGYYTSSTYHSMKAGETRVVSVVLKDRNSVGVLSVGTTPVGAKLYVDNVLRGTTPRSVGRLNVGAHTLKLTKVGYQPYETTFDIQGQQVTKLIIDLVPK